MEIRRAGIGDIPGLMALLRQVELVHYDIRPDIFRNGGEKYDTAALESLLMDENRPVLAALEDGKLVGYAFCILRKMQGNPVLQDRRELYIDDLCVEEACRGKGVAGSLWKQVQALAGEAHCDAITLNVWEGNDRARRFYDHCGFRPQRTILEYPLQGE